MLDGLAGLNWSPEGIPIRKLGISTGPEGPRESGNTGT